MDILTQIRNLKEYISRGSQLALVHDKNGKIVEILSSPEFLQDSSIASLLEKTKDINSIYDFDAATMAKWPGGKGFVQKHAPDSRLEDTDVYTTLPHTVLFTRSIGKDLYFATIRNNFFAPNIIVKNFSSLMFIDMIEDRLVGFNRSFHDLFKAKFRNADHLLGAPVGELLSPTPFETQHGKAAGLDLDGFEKGVFSDERLAHGHAEGWEADIFTAGTRINTRASDFRLAVEADFDADQCPFCIFGEPYDAESDLGLDTNGYMLGIHGNYFRPVIKKSTFFASRSAPLHVPAGRHLLHFCCQNQTLAFYIDRKLIVSFFDHDFIHRHDTALSLCVRKGYRASIKGARLALVERRDSSVRNRPALVQLKTEGRDSFLMEPFYNTTLSTNYFQHVGGYLISNVTAMQERAQELESRIKKYARDESRLKKTITRLKGGENLFVTESPQMVEIRSRAVQAAASGAVILITGETGTGKEVLARYIHETGPRAAMPFIKVDCATIPTALMESQLFGHVRGAFTGATADHMGFFEQADQGTLFLDEVGNLGPETQAKLLQFFNDYTITPVGGAGPRRLDVHCVLATNSDLGRMVRAGKFREDLFYRIYNIVLSLPPLRKRPLDIPVLCRHFLDHYGRKAGRDFKGFSKEAMDRLLTWEWPGNVRELQTVVQRAALFAPGGFVGPEDILLSRGKEEQRKKRTPFRIAMTDRKVVEEALKSSQGVVSKAAKALGIDRRTLYNFMNSQNLKPDQFRQGLTFSGPSA